MGSAGFDRSPFCSRRGEKFPELIEELELEARENFDETLGSVRAGLEER